MLDTSIEFRNPYYYVSHFNFYGLKRYAKKFFGSEKIARFIEVTSDRWYNHSFRIHKFFLPELIYFLKNINNKECKKLAQIVTVNTWYWNVFQYEHEPVPQITDFSEIDKELNVPLKSYQHEFIEVYNRKQIYDLRGYLLAFEQGLGKTLTSLALMTSLKKNAVIIIAPKKTLLSVWKYHIEAFYKKKKKIWIAGYNESDPSDCDYYIVNYESMSKIFSLDIHKNCGIIVDESHNFLHINSNRSQNLIALGNKLKCNDILLMSGTPLKAIGTEMIPMLSILDKNFDDIARQIFVKSFGLSSSKANVLFHNRLGITMYRKMKSEVLQLPPKNEVTIQVKLPDGDSYTLDKVKEEVRKFISERRQYYAANKAKYEQMFDEVIEFLDKSKLAGTPDYIRYKKIVATLRKYGVPKNPEDIHWSVDYEKKVILPLLPSQLKKNFLASKSVVKYVNLKIMGETIGGLLVRLRNQMCQGLIRHGNIERIIDEAKKKTILFTSYADCVKLATDYYNSKGFNCVNVYGGTVNPEASMKKFKTDPQVNPLIASIQTLSTGVTLTEANTIVFLNKPWRYIEYQQASDRIHRIGQDTEVFIYTVLLDTGSKENLSTRMEAIEVWSKQMFEEIVNEKLPDSAIAALHENVNAVLKYEFGLIMD